MNKSSKFNLYLSILSGLTFITLGTLLILTPDKVIRFYYLSMFSLFFVNATVKIMLFLTEAEKNVRISYFSMGTTAISSLVTALVVLLSVFFTPGLIHYIISFWMIVKCFVLFMDAYSYKKKKNNIFLLQILLAVFFIFAIPLVLFTVEYALLQLTALGIVFISSGVEQIVSGLMRYKNWIDYFTGKKPVAK